MSKETIKQFNTLWSEITSLYHDAAVKYGISDSVQTILLILNDHNNSCMQSVIYRESGISRQTINSAIRKLEASEIVSSTQGIGRNTIVSLTNKGMAFATEKIFPLIEIENEIFNEWTNEEQAEYLRLTKKYRDQFKEKLARTL